METEIDNRLLSVLSELQYEQLGDDFEDETFDLIELTLLVLADPHNLRGEYEI